MRPFVVGLRGKSVWLKFPADYTLDVCFLEDTILTPIDLKRWQCAVDSGVAVIGTLGPNAVLYWDRPVVGVTSTGEVYAFHIAAKDRIVKVSDNLRKLVSRGVDPDYVDCINWMQTCEDGEQSEWTLNGRCLVLCKRSDDDQVGELPPFACSPEHNGV